MSIAQEAPAEVTAPAVSGEFDYTPLSPLAPISLLLGIAGLSAFLGFYGIFIALIALVFSWVTLRRIRQSEGAIGGVLFARIGLVLSSIAFVAGTAMFSVAYATECPEGYERVNFPRQISGPMFQFDELGRRQIHEDVVPLLDRPIFIKGFVYQTQTTRNRRSFILLKDNGKCCFGGKPQPFDMIQIHLADDHPPIDFPALSMVSVAGKLHADPTAPEGAAVYTMEADKCELARTRF